ncbi:MAG: glutamine--fructose-6-phosphate transaminase (isomerizing) [Candidatus Moranbacteria bacterium]|nr:glutamine--fructose-6-phosphate transaminase (isomerizing) [Candidatus Moranbacteria bacterium]
MCGIIGYIGKRNAKDFLIEGLRRLEYRGYDSAGMAVMKDGRIFLTKAVGKVAELESKIRGDARQAMLGIAHTRWATHGKPSETNAHPHADCFGNLSLVHNGIVENYQELRDMLVGKGHRFVSETDSEVIAHLVEEELKSCEFEDAFTRALSALQGTYGVAMMGVSDPEKLFVARKGSPLVIGVGTDEYLVASDVSAMVGHVSKVIYLEDGEMAIIDLQGYRVKTLDHELLEKEEQILEWSQEQAQKGGHPHFMIKEILEQPKSFEDALRGRLLVEEGLAKLGGLMPVEERLRKIDRIVIASCGTSYHAGLAGEYMLEEYAGIPVEVEYASEFRYRKSLIDERTAVIALSQSGETADTLAAVREAKRKGALTLGVVNVVGSTIARETDAGIYNHAGPEVSVASTKAFTSQLAILALLTLYFGRMRGMSLVTGKRIAEGLRMLPSLIEKVAEQSEPIKKMAKKYQDTPHFLYLGRKYNMPIALEGALKIKEIAYVPAQGYPTGEMKHGPIALIDEQSLCLFIAPKDSVYEKSISGLEEIKARGGRVIVITTEGNEAIGGKADEVILIPKTLELLTPILSIIPLQLFAYHMSVAKGYDVDRPRNLAKSVTVE